MRCVNIDWLECFCIEDSMNYPHNADYFRKLGFEVREREYGTPMYREMFTLYDHCGEPFIEIRRSPKSDNRNLHGLFDPASAHVRLSNRACYATEAARMMQQFMEQHGFAFQRISRIDICLDFETFDFGDDPQKFIQRYMAGRYSKINQANISAHGLDQWDGRTWNSISWGAKTSMITTKIYNKTMELRQVHDKPYIRQAWERSGLVDDMFSLTKKRHDGTIYKPEIWRVEFSIKSGTRGWFVIDDYSGDKRQKRSIKNTLDMYFTRQQLFQVFLSLADHYFHFKYVEYKNQKTTPTTLALSAIIRDELHELAWSPGKSTRELQRKDRCKDKELFRKSDLETFYSLETVSTSVPRDAKLDSFLVRLYAYRASHGYDPKILDACNVLISAVENIASLRQLATPFDRNELEITRRLLALRLNNSHVPFAISREQAEIMYQVERTLWHETISK